MDSRIGVGFCQSYRNKGVMDVCLGCGGVGVEWIGGLDQGLEGWSGVMSV